MTNDFRSYKCYLHLFMIVRTKIIGNYSLFVTHYSLFGIQIPLQKLFIWDGIQDGVI